VSSLSSLHSAASSSSAPCLSGPLPPQAIGAAVLHEITTVISSSSAASSSPHGLGASRVEALFYLRAQGPPTAPSVKLPLNLRQIALINDMCRSHALSQRVGLVELWAFSIFSHLLLLSKNRLFEGAASKALKKFYIDFALGYISLEAEVDKRRRIGPLPKLVLCDREGGQMIGHVPSVREYLARLNDVENILASSRRTIPAALLDPIRERIQLGKALLSSEVIFEIYAKDFFALASQFTSARCLNKTSKKSLEEVALFCSFFAKAFSQEAGLSCGMVVPIPEALQELHTHVDYFVQHYGRFLKKPKVLVPGFQKLKQKIFSIFLELSRYSHNSMHYDREEGGDGTAAQYGFSLAEGRTILYVPHLFSIIAGRIMLQVVDVFEKRIILPVAPEYTTTEQVWGGICLNCEYFSCFLRSETANWIFPAGFPVHISKILNGVFNIIGQQVLIAKPIRGLEKAGITINLMKQSTLEEVICKGEWDHVIAIQNKLERFMRRIAPAFSVTLKNLLELSRMAIGMIPREERAGLRQAFIEVVRGMSFRAWMPFYLLTKLCENIQVFTGKEHTLAELKARNALMDLMLMEGIEGVFDRLTQHPMRESSIRSASSSRSEGSSSTSRSAASTAAGAGVGLHRSADGERGGSVSVGRSAGGAASSGARRSASPDGKRELMEERRSVRSAGPSADAAMAAAGGGAAGAGARRSPSPDGKRELTAERRSARSAGPSASAAMAAAGGSAAGSPVPSAAAASRAAATQSASKARPESTLRVFRAKTWKIQQELTRQGYNLDNGRRSGTGHARYRDPNGKRVFLPIGGGHSHVRSRVAHSIEAALALVKQ